MESKYEDLKKMTPKRKRNHWEEVGKLLGLEPETARRKWNSKYI